MKTNLTRRLVAILYVSLISFGSFAKAQDESLFDTIESNSHAATAADSAPRMKIAPRNGSGTGARMKIAPRPVSPGIGFGGDGVTESAPQAMVMDPSAAVDGTIGHSYVMPGSGVEHRVMPVLPSTCGFLPKLGFQGRLIPGVGMQVISVNYGGVAHREGLETGDIIVEISGRRILYEYDYERALVDAAVYSYGQVSLLVRNVRHRPGCLINPAYVRVSSQLPMRHVHSDPYGIVAAR